ncbi:hypothetical protein CCHR01_16163 [Colletotrichum chrysophilum]|uniref:Uncharacterized protein n=1 Tax=Colletotrichum chrysophilum TaxID=1836956 RepID=A0AAD9A6X2_9PEZI|nr:hypothetical protein CCHR01_16163 [Colletotrichum chrysophilum]
MCPTLIAHVVSQSKSGILLVGFFSGKPAGSEIATRTHAFNSYRTTGVPPNTTGF